MSQTLRYLINTYLKKNVSLIHNILKGEFKL